ncbi:hypothetical protein PhaeoP10_00706 [Phaeobacter inhibens]|nr:hypothetical protein PhaeoP10_00706 [Phaeobacter inhibens]
MALDLSKLFVGENANGAAKGHPILSSFYVWLMYRLLFVRLALPLSGYRLRGPREQNVRHHNKRKGSRHPQGPGSDIRAQGMPPLLQQPIDQGAAAIASPRGTRFPDLAEKGAGPPRDGRTAPETSAQATSRCRRCLDGEGSRRRRSPDDERTATDSPRRCQSALQNRACSSLIRAPCQRKAPDASNPRFRAAASAACDVCFARNVSIS